MVTTLPKEPFQKWGLDFIGPIELASTMSGNQYILITINYNKMGGRLSTLHQHCCSNCQVFI
jgi:hypothetical protein